MVVRKNVVSLCRNIVYSLLYSCCKNKINDTETKKRNF